MGKPLIFDVGMHNGDDTAFYLAKGFRVVAIEAHPGFCAAAATRFGDAIERGDLIIENVGIAYGPGVLPLYVNGVHDEWSSLDKYYGARRELREIIEVPTVRLDAMFEKHGAPYYLKIDIEGFDRVALAGLAASKVRPRFVSCENGYPEMVRLLQTLGYNSWKFVNQANITEAQCPVPAREGETIDWKFPFGATGPFGEDLEGEWLNFAQALRVTADHWAKPDLNAAVDGWFDLHARHGG